MKKFNADVSHVVTLGNEQRKAKRTMKFLKAVAAQKYVVDYRCKVSKSYHSS